MSTVQNFDVNSNTLNEFIQTCVLAEKKGLKLAKCRGKYRMKVLLNELHVEATLYNVTRWNGRGRNAQGFTMLTAWLKPEAEKLSGVIHLYIANSNPKMLIEIRPTKESLDLRDLKWFLALRTKRPTRK